MAEMVSSAPLSPSDFTKAISRVKRDLSNLRKHGHIAALVGEPSSLLRFILPIFADLLASDQDESADLQAKFVMAINPERLFSVEVFQHAPIVHVLVRDFLWAHRVAGAKPNESSILHALGHLYCDPADDEERTAMIELIVANKRRGKDLDAAAANLSVATAELRLAPPASHGGEAVPVTNDQPITDVDPDVPEQDDPTSGTDSRQNSADVRATTYPARPEYGGPIHNSHRQGLSNRTTNNVGERFQGPDPKFYGAFDENGTLGARGQYVESGDRDVFVKAAASLRKTLSHRKTFSGATGNESVDIHTALQEWAQLCAEHLIPVDTSYPLLHILFDGAARAFFINCVKPAIKADGEMSAYRQACALIVRHFASPASKATEYARLRQICLQSYVKPGDRSYCSAVTRLYEDIMATRVRLELHYQPEAILCDLFKDAVRPCPWSAGAVDATPPGNLLALSNAVAAAGIHTPIATGSAAGESAGPSAVDPGVYGVLAAKDAGASDVDIFSAFVQGSTSLPPATMQELARPTYGARVRTAAQEKRRANISCFRCGTKGHYRSEGICDPDAVRRHHLARLQSGEPAAGILHELLLFADKDAEETAANEDEEGVSHTGFAVGYVAPHEGNVWDEADTIAASADAFVAAATSRMNPSSLPADAVPLCATFQQSDVDVLGPAPMMARPSHDTDNTASTTEREAADGGPLHF
jgi:hypothetical protein